MPVKSAGEWMAVHIREVSNTVSTAKKSTPANHVFTLIVAGASELTVELENALFEAGCDDALLGVRDGVLFLDFDREAATFQDAVAAAVTDVERAATELRVSRVEPDELVTAAEIARRTGRSRQSVQQLVLGRRGPGGFPPPVSGLRRRSPIWRWTEVAQWFAEKGDPVALAHVDLIETGTAIGAINAALDLRRYVPNQREATKLCRSLNPKNPIRAIPRRRQSGH